MMRGWLAMMAMFALVACKGGDNKASKLTPAEQAASPKCRAQCKINGRCHWLEDACRAHSVHDCVQADVCKSSGLCSFSEGACVGTSAADCQRSEQCKAAGACSLIGSDRRLPCGPKDDSDCETSELCSRKGRCTAVGGVYKVASANDCVRSAECKRHGRCSVKEVKGVAATFNICAALSNDDCKRGVDCSQHGKCTAVGDACR